MKRGASGGPRLGRRGFLAAASSSAALFVIPFRLGATETAGAAGFNRVLAHQFDGQEDIRRIVGDHVEYPYTPKPKGDATADAAGPKARATAKKAGGR